MSATNYRQQEDCRLYAKPVKSANNDKMLAKMLQNLPTQFDIRLSTGIEQDLCIQPDSGLTAKAE